jgi:signal transduction histidine kinase
MAFSLVIAVAIFFEPLPAMVISGLGAFDMREIRREIPLWRAVFNRCQQMLATAAGSTVAHSLPATPFEFPAGTLVITLSAATLMATNFTLVAIMVQQDQQIPLRQAVNALIPRPVGGFLLSQALLAGMGAATAVAFAKYHYFVAAALIPLLFARLSILGARSQQELAEKVRQQQQALLEATEKVFQERENERKRIAEEIHDSSLQLLAAASYGCRNASAFLGAGRRDEATASLTQAGDAVDEAIRDLRQSLVDLRRSSVEEGGLMKTIQSFAEQMRTLWGNEISIKGGIRNEPPIPVALAALQILQEGLTNALKHASGPVTINVQELDDKVHIVVQDNGKGFNTDKEIGLDHVGIRLMRERAERVGGRIKLDSEPGTGTRLEAVLPAGVTQ